MDIFNWRKVRSAFPSWVRSIMPSLREGPLESSLSIPEDDVTVIDLENVKLIPSVRKELNRIRTKRELTFAFTDPSCLGIIVPYRNREEHIHRFLPYLQKYLDQQDLHYRILVVEQLDQNPFNRGALLNVGSNHLQNDCDAFCFHDVDLLPLNTRYRTGTQPLSLVTNRRNEETNALEIMPPHFFGGVTSISREQFLQVNGFSNRFWGWGLEDDNFLFRCLFSGLHPCRLSPSEYIEMAHFDGRVANIEGKIASKTELARMKSNLRRNGKIQSGFKRKLIDPEHDGFQQLIFVPRELPPICGVERIGASLEEQE